MKDSCITPRDRAKAAFIEWFVKNYPPNCIIYKPEWHAPKVFRAGEAALDDAGLLPSSETRGIFESPEDVDRRTMLAESEQQFDKVEQEYFYEPHAGPDTPRTNGVAVEGHTQQDIYRLLQHARQLERELADVKMALALQENAASQLADMAVDSLPSAKAATFDEGVEAAALLLERQITAMAAHTNPDGIVTGEDFYDVELVILRDVLARVRKLPPTDRGGA